MWYYLFLPFLGALCSPLNVFDPKIPPHTHDYAFPGSIFVSVKFPLKCLPLPPPPPPPSPLCTSTSLPPFLLCPPPPLPPNCSHLVFTFYWLIASRGNLVTFVTSSEREDEIMWSWTVARRLFTINTLIVILSALSQSRERCQWIFAVASLNILVTDNVDQEMFLIICEKKLSGAKPLRFCSICGIFSRLLVTIMG